MNVTLKSQHPIQNIYSPSHAITMSRTNDRTATIGFAKEQAISTAISSSSTTSAPRTSA